MTILLTSSIVSFSQSKDTVKGKFYSKEQLLEIATKIQAGKQCEKVSAQKDTSIILYQKTISIMQNKMTVMQQQNADCDTLNTYYKANLLYWKDRYETIDKKFSTFKKYTTIGGISLGVLIIGILIVK